MKSGLEGRNNPQDPRHPRGHHHVSMKSGLEGRNNIRLVDKTDILRSVSMKSGLEGRNNLLVDRRHPPRRRRLNEVRPRRPEQSTSALSRRSTGISLNEVRPRRPEQLGRCFIERSHYALSQ